MELLNLEELGRIVNNDAKTVKIFQALRARNDNIEQYQNALDYSITSVSISAVRAGWRIFINFRNNDAVIISSATLLNRSLVELFVCQKKIPEGGSAVNEFLRERIIK